MIRDKIKNKTLGQCYIREMNNVFLIVLPSLLPWPFKVIDKSWVSVLKSLYNYNQSFQTLCLCGAWRPLVIMSTWEAYSFELHDLKTAKKEDFGIIHISGAVFLLIQDRLCSPFSPTRITTDILEGMLGALSKGLFLSVISLDFAYQ